MVFFGDGVDGHWGWKGVRGIKLEIDGGHDGEENEVVGSRRTLRLLEVFPSVSCPCQQTK
jgi:hypothetical protein